MTKRDQANSSKVQRRRRRNKQLQVKVGHGGTLDPMATGVLIVGVGNGTKQLQSFLECSKSYETSILFGAATDTYDVLGRILKKAPYAHITLDSVETALNKFRGPIMQRPPIYSALRIDGKRLYEYAREGKEVPREIKERPVTVHRLNILEWLPAGTHNYSWPSDQAGGAEKGIADQVLHREQSISSTENSPTGEDVVVNTVVHGLKRKRQAEVGDNIAPDVAPATKRQELSIPPIMSGGLQVSEDCEDEEDSHAAARLLSGQASSNNSPSSIGPPAARLSMTVTSGFYVRSFCHDLGQEVGSLGIMSELIRKRQGDFNLGENVLEYGELEKGEDVWAPKVERLLAEWETYMLRRDKEINLADDGTNA